MTSQRSLDAIESSDTDDLLRIIDGHCASQAWDDLVDLRHRCREAVTRGKQLWGVEEHIRYRLALEAPPRFAGPVVSEGVARFALGPLGEVAASTKTWLEMEPHLEHGPERMTFAGERVVRGEHEVGPVIDLPSRLMEWEPEYPVAIYKAHKLEAPSPPPPKTTKTTLDSPVNRIDDPESEGALADLVQPWSEQSNGHCETATVAGSGRDAIRALGLTKTGIAELSLAEAMTWMVWAGSSGGAHGRRRGAAAGRFGAWWALSALCDIPWPPDPDVLGEEASRLEWSWFDDGGPGTGWQLRLAIEDPEAGLAWAVAAIDLAD